MKKLNTMRKLCHILAISFIILSLITGCQESTNDSTVTYSDNLGNTNYDFSMISFPSETGSYSDVFSSDGKIFVFETSGGTDENSLNYGLYEYNLENDEYTALDVDLPTNASYWASSANNNGIILMGYFLEGEGDVYHFIEIDTQTNKVKTIDLSYLIDDYSYIESVLIDDRENIYMVCTDESSSAYTIVVDAQLSVLAECEIEDKGTISVLLNQNGDVVYGISKDTSYHFKTLNLDTAAWEESISLDLSSATAFGSYADTFLLITQSELYSFSVGDNELIRLLDFSYLGIVPSFSIQALSSGQFIMGGTTMYIFTETEGASSPTSLTLGTVASDSDLASIKAFASEYNNTNTDYTIKVVTYNIDNDLETAITKLNTEIISGNGPDILDLTNLPYELYANTGYLEDLYPFIDADEGMEREDFVQSVLSSLEVSGDLYCVVPTYFIVTIAANPDYITSDTDWTMESLLDISESLPENTTLFGESLSKADFLQYFLQAGTNNYINWETGEVRINSNSFVRLLEFANTLPDEVSAEYNEISKALYEETQILKIDGLASLEYIQEYRALFQGDVNLIGFPSTNQSHTAIDPSIMIGMSSQTEHKDIAWDFIRRYITEDYNESEYSTYGISIRDDLMEQNIQLSIESINESVEIWEEQDVQVDYPQFVDMDFSAYTAARPDLDETHFRDLINSIDSIWSNDITLYEIILEEANSYFSGDKSVQQALEIAQNRVTTWVSEQK